MKVCLRCQRAYPHGTAGFCENDGGELRVVLSEYVPEESALVGRALAGRYVIDKLLGSGGMGIVVRAKHVFLDRMVAVKLLHPQLLMVREVRERFLREAQTAAKLRHPNVVEITDSGVTQEGLHYLVMEYLEGENLHDWVTRVGRIDPRTAAQIGAQVCSALTVIHQNGFIHRDLKPENVWVLSGDGAPRVKVLDFGIAGLAATDGESAEKRLTRTGSTVGTPHYMSPEQGQGMRLDGRADLYALGCILFEIVTGELAFPGTSAVDILTRQLLQAPRAPSSVRVGVPAWFDEIVLRCLCKAPADRFGDAAELERALVEGAQRPAVPMPSTLEYAVEAPDALAATAVGIPTPGRTDFRVAGTTPVATAAHLGTLRSSRRTVLWASAAVVVLAGIGFAAWRSMTSDAPAPTAAADARPAPPPVERRAAEPSQRPAPPAAVAAEPPPPPPVERPTVALYEAEVEEGMPLRRDPEPTPVQAAPPPVPAPEVKPPPPVVRPKIVRPKTYEAPAGLAQPRN